MKLQYRTRFAALVAILVFICFVHAHPDPRPARLYRSATKPSWMRRLHSLNSLFRRKASHSDFASLKTSSRSSLLRITGPQQQFDHTSSYPEHSKLDAKRRLTEFSFSHPDDSSPDHYLSSKQRAILVRLSASTKKGAVRRTPSREKALSTFLSTVAFDTKIRKATHSLADMPEYLPTLIKVGLNFDPCGSDNDCIAPRTCAVFSGGEIVPCQSEMDCICVPTQNEGFNCLTTNDCDLREVCTIYTSGMLSTTFCVSSAVVDDVASLEEAGTGLNYFECTSDEDCKSPRKCEGSNNDACFADALCRCFLREAPTCSATSDCELGEVCAVGGDIPNPLCISAVVVSGDPRIQVFEPTSSPIVFPSTPPFSTPSISPLPSLSSLPASPSPASFPSNATPSASSTLPVISPESTFIFFPSPFATESPPFSPETGLTGETCVFDEECESQRTCLSTGGPCSLGDACVCFPEKLTFCATTADCELGEVCATSDISEPICLSAAVVDGNQFQEVPELSETPTEPSPEPSPVAPDAFLIMPLSGGLTGDHCELNVGCLGSRACMDTNGECAFGNDCACVPEVFVFCSSTAECTPGEVCATDGNTEPLCVSANFVAAGSFEEV